MTISNGRLRAGAFGGIGGGISADRPMVLSGVHVTGNEAQYGGGVFLFNGGGSVFVNSTLSGNLGTVFGGGLYFSEGGALPLRLVNTTISGNRSPLAGGIQASAFTLPSNVEAISSTIADNHSDLGVPAGIRLEGQGSPVRLTLRNSIVSDNLPLNFGQSGSQITFASQGFNLSNNYNGRVTTLVSDRTGNARLGPLAPHGGPVPTHLLLGGSDALDAGSSSGQALDQRGVLRRFDVASIGNAGNGSDASDIGAVEMQATIVSNADNDGPGSLRAALTAANGNGPGLDDIIFNVTAFATPQIIVLTSALPTVASAVTITGTGADRLTVRRGAGNPAFRILTIGPNLEIAALSGLRIRDGTVVENEGGGILSASPLTLAGVHVVANLAFNGIGGGVALRSGGTFLDSTFSLNGATQAAGIAVLDSGARPLRISNCTISRNSATGPYGGVLIRASGAPGGGRSSLDMVNSTVAFNTASAIGGIASVSDVGIAASASLRNSIVANNTPPNLDTFANSGAASIRSRGFNLSNTQDGSFLNQLTDQTNAIPGLVALAMNGGPTPTHALAANSQAQDGGDNSGSGRLFDQRGVGFDRPVDLQSITNLADGSDIGAYEAQSRPDVLFANGFD
jgi:hypothetical protein